MTSLIFRFSGAKNKFRNKKINLNKIHYLPGWGDPIKPYVKILFRISINLSSHF